MTEKLSALFDGHLEDGMSSDSVFDSLRQDRRMRQKWGTYCLIGDALRGEAQAAPDLSGRVLARLGSEPTVLAPSVPRPLPSRSTRLGRIMLPVAASVMGVAAVGWVVQASHPAGAPATTLAAKAPLRNAQVAAALAQTAPSSEDSLRNYVFAHQSVAGGSPIPGVAQYVRAVSEVRQGADR